VLAIAASTVYFLYKEKLIAYFIPKVEQIGDIEIKIKNDTSYISTRLVVRNGSFLKIQLDTLKYKIALFDTTYLESSKYLGLTLPGYGSDSLDFSFKVPHIAIINHLREERYKQDSAGYSVNVFLQYTTALGSSEMPISKTGKLKIPHPPKLSIEDIKWTKLRFKTLKADVQIKIINYGDVAIDIKDLHYTMNIQEHADLKGVYSKAISIKPNAVTMITVPIEINTKHIGKTVLDVMRNKDQYNYTLLLEAFLESKDTDKTTFHLNLSQKGELELKK
jgi:LEA14-like dessication related protein